MWENNLPQANYANPTAMQTLSAFMSKIYMWMMGGLVVTGLVAWQTANSPYLIQNLLYNPTLFYLLIFAELGIVMAMSFMSKRFSATTLALCFIIYSFVNGLTLSVIFLVYTTSSITQTFFISAGMFGGMSLYGYITKRDLTSWGSFLVMGLWGIILASIVNLFFQTSGLSLLISFLGVFIFLGLTAYDTQKLKEMSYAVGDEQSEGFNKMVIFGALSLYLDFINLFLHLLRLLGSRRD